MSRALRAVAMEMLRHAATVRDEAQRRVWESRDAATRLRLLHLEAQQVEAIAVRELASAQEILDMVWTDLKPSLSGQSFHETEDSHAI